MAIVQIGEIRSRSPKRYRSAGHLLIVAILLTACGTSSDPNSPPTSTDPDALECVGPATASASNHIVPISLDPDQELPVTVTDLTGREITITDTSRILALDTYGTLAATVYALGLGDRLVGRDISTGIPELEHLPLVTQNGHQLNGEAILNLNPTLVLTDYSIGPLEVQLQVMDSGIPVVIFSDERSRAGITPQILAVAEALGVPAQGAALAARVETEVQTAEAHVSALVPVDHADRLRMIFLYMRGGAGIYYWFGDGSGASDLITGLGGIDVASEIGLDGMKPINAEGMVRANPDMFLMMTHGLESVGGVEGLFQVPGIADTRAGATSCVVDMIDYQVLSFGPQYPATLEALTAAIYYRAAR